MKVYAIKHKPTGEWMPSNAGSQWAPGRGAVARPKLFASHRGTAGAIVQWLRGHADAQQPRRREDLEVVEMDLPQ